MDCPVCGKWANVIDTRRNSDGSVRRRYECGNGHRFSTLAKEVVVSYKKDGKNIRIKPDESKNRVGHTRR